jgi:acyl carrier protein
MQSIQWGPWADTGLMGEGQERGAQRMYEAQGVLPIAPALGFGILERALATSAPVLFAASMNWELFATACGTDAGASEFLHLAGTANGGTSAGQSAANAKASDAADTSALDVRATFAALAPGRPRLGAIEAYLREQLARVLKTAPERLDLQKPMGSMGVDSLLALEFVRQLSRTLGIKVPATVVFNYPTIKKLAVLLESRMGFTDETTPAATPQPAPPPAQQPVPASATDSAVDEMSDLDAIRALSGKRS